MSGEDGTSEQQVVQRKLAFFDFERVDADVSCALAFSRDCSHEGAALDVTMLVLNGLELGDELSDAHRDFFSSSCFGQRANSHVPETVSGIEIRENISKLPNFTNYLQILRKCADI